MKLWKIKWKLDILYRIIFTQKSLNIYSYGYRETVVITETAYVFNTKIRTLAIV